MVLLFWVVIPLISAIFTFSVTRKDIDGVATDSASLMPLGEQSSNLTSGFMMNAYRSLWLDQALPGFTSREFALLPFEMHSADTEAVQDPTWTSDTFMYSTNLSCKPAIVQQTPQGESYDNGDGCVLEPLGTILRQ